MARKPKPDRPRRPVLVVQANEDVRDALAAALAAQGYLVDTAGDGEEAFRRLKQGKLPCLIIVDLQMPTMNGLEFHRRQLKDPTLAAIPVVFYASDMVEYGDGNVAGKPAPDDLGGLEEILELVAHHCQAA